MIFLHLLDQSELGPKQEIAKIDDGGMVKKIGGGLLKVDLVDDETKSLAHFQFFFISSSYSM
jgi:hypothetical protein